MRFDDDSQLDTSQVRDTRGVRRLPRRGGVAIGGGAGILGLVVFILLQLLGGGGTTTSGALPGIDQVQGETGNLAQECKTGADANAKLDCRVVAVVNSVQDFWAAEFQRRGAQYQQAPTTLFSGGVQTGCGTASSDVGPFYCPRDATVYIDLSFYRDLQTRFGAQGGPFAQAYVLAHEYGHHVQNLSGTMDEVANARSTGPQGAPPAWSSRPTATPACGPTTPPPSPAPTAATHWSSASPPRTSPTAWTPPPPSATTPSRSASRARSAPRPGPTAPPPSASGGSPPATAPATSTSATPSAGSV